MTRARGWKQALLAALSLCGAAGFAAEPGLRTRAEFDTWLAAHPESPVNALSPGARERFLVSLRFADAGLVSLDPNDIADELDDAQIRALMAPFGARVLAYAPRSHAEETRAYDRGGKAGIGAIERRYNDYYRAAAQVDDPQPELRQRRRTEAFDANLGDLYTPAALRRVTDHELRLLRRAAREFALATTLPPHVEAFDHVFAERARRKLVSADDVRSLRDLYLALHRFPDARKLSREYPGSGLPPLPQFEDSIGAGAGRPTAWRFDASGKRLTRTAYDLAPLQILVVAACHLSKDAARDIGADALLGPVFARHAQWLVPAPGQESVQDAQQWNLELPAMPVAMIYDRAEWGVLPHWNMPTFFVVRDGKIIDSASGWASGDAVTRDALVATLRRTGLLPPQ